MKITRSMKYEPSWEAREIELYAMNDEEIYQHYFAEAKAIAKKKVFIEEKAINSLYRVATMASKKYAKDIGTRFNVTARYTAAVNMLEVLKEDVQWMKENG